MYRKLSAEEISAVIGKIRRKYDEYCTKFFKAKRIKQQFEDRYLNALKQGVDVSNFLLAEISAIEELIRIEEEKIQAAPVVEKPAQKKTDFADKIIAENMQKIEKYTAISIHKDANPEVKRLLGALNCLYEQHFPALHSILRKIHSNAGNRDVTAIENKLRQLGYLGNERVSASLARYYTLINQFPRDYRAVEREEKDYILESAFMLHDLRDLLIMINEQNHLLESRHKEEFKTLYDYVDGLISDFRLKELRRKK